MTARAPHPMAARARRFALLLAVPIAQAASLISLRPDAIRSHAAQLRDRGFTVVPAPLVSASLIARCAPAPRHAMGSAFADRD